MKNIENDSSAVVTAKLLAIPPAWEEKEQDEIARLAKEHLGVEWVDGYTCLVVTCQTRGDGAGTASCPKKLGEEVFAKVEKTLGRSLSCDETALIAERYAETLAGTPLEVGVTGALLFPGIPQDGSALEIIAFVQVRANGRGDGLEWYVDFSVRLAELCAKHRKEAK